MSGKILLIKQSLEDIISELNNLKDVHILQANGKHSLIAEIYSHLDIDLFLIDTDEFEDAEDLIGIIKSHKNYKETPIIVLSNRGIKELGRLLKYEIADFIMLPQQKYLISIKADMHLKLNKMHTCEQSHAFNSYKIFDTLFQQASIGISISHSDKSSSSLNGASIVKINSAFEKITGRTKEELVHLSWAQITHPDDVEEDLRLFEKLQAGEIDSYNIEKRYIKPDGSITWADIVVTTLDFPKQDRHNHICLIRDITEKKKSEEALREIERAQSVLLSNLPGMAYKCLIDKDWTMKYVSNACFKITGYQKEDLIDNKTISYNKVISPNFREKIQKQTKNCLSKDLAFNYEYEITDASGNRKWILDIGQGVKDASGKLSCIEGIIFNITKRKIAEDNLNFINEHDTFTGLKNRKNLENTLQNLIKNKEKKALISVNLNSIYSLSLANGFQYSQEVIKKVADELKTLETDSLELFKSFEYRFVFFVKKYQLKDELVAICCKIIKVLESALALERIGAGLGVLEIGAAEKDFNKILKNLLVASEKALNTSDKDFDYCFYDKDLENEVKRQEIIKNELFQIVDQNRTEKLLLEFHPIIDIKTNKINSFEALSRLMSSELGRVAPLEFIPIAEKTKLIILLGEQIIIKALKFLKRLKQAGFDDTKISINISPIQFLKKDFTKRFVKILNDMDISAADIVIEITESAVELGCSEINERISHLRKNGVSVAIDDFGAEYSSLARIRDLNIDCIKIDKSFIDRFLQIDLKKSIVDDIIGIAHKINCCVIAEGVQTQSQLDYLTKFGCDMVQGYLISKPLQEDDALNFIKNYNKKN